MLRFKTWFKTWFKLLFRKHWCLLIICSLCVILAITLYDTSNQAVNWNRNRLTAPASMWDFPDRDRQPMENSQINSFREA